MISKFYVNIYNDLTKSFIISVEFDTYEKAKHYIEISINADKNENVKEGLLKYQLITDYKKEYYEYK